MRRRGTAPLLTAGELLYLLEARLCVGRAADGRARMTRCQARLLENCDFLMLLPHGMVPGRRPALAWPLLVPRGHGHVDLANERFITLVRASAFQAIGRR